MKYYFTDFVIETGPFLKNDESIANDLAKKWIFACHSTTVLHKAPLSKVAWFVYLSKVPRKAEHSERWKSKQIMKPRSLGTAIGPVNEYRVWCFWRENSILAFLNIQIHWPDDDRGEMVVGKDGGVEDLAELANGGSLADAGSGSDDNAGEEAGELWRCCYKIQSFFSFKTPMGTHPIY